MGMGLGTLLFFSIASVSLCFSAALPPA
jgi:hypothetical protein